MKELGSECCGVEFNPDEGRCRECHEAVEGDVENRNVLNVPPRPEGLEGSDLEGEEEKNYCGCGVEIESHLKWCGLGCFDEYDDALDEDGSDW